MKNSEITAIIFAAACVIVSDCDKISDLRLCGDPKCEEPVSLAITMTKYVGDYGHMLSFEPKKDVKIYSKSAGSNPNLWGAEIGGKRGYVPQNMVRETKVLKKPEELVYKVPTESVETGGSPTKPLDVGAGAGVTVLPVGANNSEEVKPSKTEKVVVEGTTLFLPEEGSAEVDENSTPVYSTETSKSVLEDVSNVKKNADPVVDSKLGDKESDENDEDGEEDDGSEEETDEEEADGELGDGEAESLNSTEVSVTEVNQSQIPETVNITSNNENALSTQETNSDVSKSIDSNIESNTNDSVIKEGEVVTPSSFPEVQTSISMDIEVTTPLSSVAETEIYEPVAKTQQPIVSEMEMPLLDVNKSIEGVVEESLNENISEDPLKDTNTSAEQEFPTETLPVEVSSESLPSDTAIVPTEDLPTEAASEVPTKFTEAAEESSVPNVENISSEVTSVPADVTETPFEASSTENSLPEQTVSKFDNVEDRSEANNESEESNSKESVETPLYEKDVNILGDFLRNSNNMKDNAVVHRKDEIQMCTEGQNANEYCQAIESTPKEQSESDVDLFPGFANVKMLQVSYDVTLYLVITAITVLVFTLGHYYIDRRRNDSSFISKINELEKALLVSKKENAILQDKVQETGEIVIVPDDSSVPKEIVDGLKAELEKSLQIRSELEEQIAELEKELEVATETGLEMNKMLTLLTSADGEGEDIIETMQVLRKRISEQQSTISNLKLSLAATIKESDTLRLEVAELNGKVFESQQEVDKMVINILKVEEERVKMQAELEAKIKTLTDSINSVTTEKNQEIESVRQEAEKLRYDLQNATRALEVKVNEYQILQDAISETQNDKEALKSFLNVSKVKAELQQLKKENQILNEHLKHENDTKSSLENDLKAISHNLQVSKSTCEQTEREKVEAQTRLEVLSAYFKEKEAQLQKELSEQSNMWLQKQGEATSTIERIKWMQDELQNYKSQNETLKKEILDQEVSFKSQVSLLEAKAHDNWVLVRQTERKLEESRQEASQLRNRLTLVEKNLSNSTMEENKGPNRMLSPIETNGEHSLSPLHMGGMDYPSGLFPGREHMTTSPPLPGMPTSFMPPPPGMPFMPPPPPGVPFMPPPPDLFPRDRRPPPLGRMSSPPLNPRYSPNSRPFSPYDDSPPSSPYDDEIYPHRPPPPPVRPFSPYSSKRRPPWDEQDHRGQRSTPRNHKSSNLSSGSGHSNESLDKPGSHTGKV